jgi:hypothetical protein
LQKNALPGSPAIKSLNFRCVSFLPIEQEC